MSLMKTHYQVWDAHADEPVTVYVPSPSADRNLRRIAPRSAIVGRPWKHGMDRVEIGFEGDVYQRGSPFADLLDQAAGRLIADYPTVARMIVTPADLVAVGTFVPRTRAFVETDAAALAAWLK